MTAQVRMTAFAGSSRLASGDAAHVARASAELAASGDDRRLLIFDDETGAQVELDPRGPVGAGTPAASATPAVPDRRAAGRPRLGVVGREVTLLPRHWEWLSSQPGGASAALRRLVEQARRDNEGTDRVRRSQEAAFRFMSALAGDEPGFEEACRALFAADASAFEARVLAWPADVRDYALTLASDAFGRG